MEIDDVSIKSSDVLHCAILEVAVIKGDFKYSVNLLHKSQLVPDQWVEVKKKKNTKHKTAHIPQ